MSQFFHERIERGTAAKTVPLPALSPAFAYADDAARFAHEMIGDRREGEYGGVILQRHDGKFFATLPVKGQSRMFSHELVLSTDADNNFLHPPGYTCHAFYHSHPNNYAEVKRYFAQWSKESVETSMNFFSPPDVVFTVGMRGFARVGYLSGLNGSLIKYVPSGSEQEAALVEGYQKGLVRAKQLISYVHELAAVGELSVIQTNDIWGWKVGKVDADFKIYNPATLPQAPNKQIQQPAYSPVFSSLLDAVKYTRLRLYQQPEQQFGYLLKYKDQAQYLATEPVPGAEHLFKPDAVFTLNAAGAVVIPRNLEVVAQYYCDNLYHAPDQVPAQQRQVYKRFVEPNAMAQSIRMSLALRFGRDVAPLPLYITVRDGALLEYQPSSTLAEEPYVRTLSQAEGGGLAIKRDLLGGHVTPTAYVHRLAQMGTLKVLYHSDLWGLPGTVDQHWTPYARLSRRALSPSFLTMDDAARYVHRKIKKSPNADRIFGGLIFQRLDQRFVATEPLAGRSETFDPYGIIPAERLDLTPTGGTIVGFYHSHRPQDSMLLPPGVEQQLYADMLEPHEVCAAIQDRDWAPVRFLSTPQGALLKYVPSGTDREKKFLARVAPPVSNPENVRHNALQLKLRTHTLKATEYVGQIVRTGDLYVVEGNTLWGNPGKVTTHWKPSPEPAPVPLATEQPALSPVFTQAQDAARYAHHRMGARTKRQFGFILKSVHSEEFVATYPLEGGGLGLDRVFPRKPSERDNTLPGDFKIHGVYLGTPATYFSSPSHVKDVRNLNTLLGFVTPDDFADALGLVNLVKQQRGAFTGDVPLYLSTNDGALLSYVPVNLWAQLTSGLFGSWGRPLLTQILNGELHVTEYVHQVAANGQLEVVIKSALWNAPGHVTQQWVPYKKAAAMPFPATRRFPLSPVFAHPDDAARYVHAHIPHPNQLNVVAAILGKADYNTYVAIEPNSGGEVANAPQTLLFTHKHVDGQLHPVPLFAAGYSRKHLLFSRAYSSQAGYSALENNLLNNMFWPVDICYATRLLKTYDSDNSFEVIYHSTNDGALLKYRRGATLATQQLCESISGSNLTYEGYFAENYEPDRTTRRYYEKAPEPQKPVELLTRVLNTGQLSVITVSRTWPNKGEVQHTLTINIEPAPGLFEWDDPRKVQLVPTNGADTPSAPWHDEL